MFSSSIIPTIGRESLARAIYSILDQNFEREDYEIIIVNDSGSSLPDAEWQHSKHVRILNTNRRRQRVARNLGASTARGRYLHFLDDDDWMLPGSLERFWDLSYLRQQAVLLYGGIRFVDGSGQHLGELNLGLEGNCFTQVVAGAFIQVAAAFIRADPFFDVGGFNPRLLSAEETDLYRRLALRGDFGSLPETVACVLRGDGWVTASQTYLASDFTRWSRDAVLNEPGAFNRLRRSATTGYWWGRILRAYLTAARWNLKNRRGFAATSRMVFGLASFALAGRYWLSADFWRAFYDHHVPWSAARVLGDSSS